MQVKSLWRIVLATAAATAVLAATSNVAATQELTRADQAVVDQTHSVYEMNRILKTKEPLPDKDDLREEEELEEEAEDKAEMNSRQNNQGTKQDAEEGSEEHSPKPKKKAHSAEKEAEEEEEEVEDSDSTDAEKKATKPKKAKSSSESSSGHTKKSSTTEEEEETDKKANEDQNDKRIEGKSRDGVLDHSAEGSAEIDKIDLRNEGKWLSVFEDPPTLVVKASLYAFIAYNDSSVCDSFNMTLDAVEEKRLEENDSYAYHVVAKIDCTLSGEDQTNGRFVLNFEPEGKRLLLTECGHREEGEIVNWLWIKSEVPECMTPDQRKEFLSQPMKNVHTSNETTSSTATAMVTDFFNKLEDGDTKEVAIAGSATVTLFAIIIVFAVFIVRKNRARRDLERTIAGAKADQADDDDDDESTEGEESAVEQGRKSTKNKDEDEGSFVNSPAVRV